MVDDATSKALGWFSGEESIWAAAAVLRRWIERYGVPQALYTDWKNVYVRPPNAGERMRGEAAVTQFGRMCAKLGIEIIPASSPQAKDYASYCTPFGRSDTSSAVSDLWESLRP
jgi:hypothetical protein